MRWRLSSLLLVPSLVACGSEAPTAGKVTDRAQSLTSLTMDDLVLLEGRTITRDDFLATLPDEFKSRYTLLFESEAEDPLDASDPTDMRVVSFGKDAKLTLAWVKNSNSIAAVTHRKTHLEFRRVTFEKSGVTVTEANPEDCAGSSCHGDMNEPHYRWDGYPRWKRAIAGNNDFVVPGSPQLERLRNFYEAAKTTPAFSMLKGASEGDPSRVIGTFRIGKLPTNEGQPKVYPKALGATSYQLRPNTFLTFAYARHTAELVFSRLDRAQYTRFRPALAFVLTRCNALALGAERIGSINASLASATPAGKTPPRIDVGTNAMNWRSWFEFVGLTDNSWRLADQPLDTVPWLYNEGFTSLGSLFGGRVWDDLVEAEPSLADLYPKGTLELIESTYFKALTYSDPGALQSQNRAIDALGTFLNTDNRVHLEITRGPVFEEKRAAACTKLGEMMKSTGAIGGAADDTKSEAIGIPTPTAE